MQEIVKSKMGELRFPIEITSENGVSLLQNEEVLGVEMSAKESAFLSKELATIKTDIEAVQDMTLNEFVLNIDKDKYKTKMLELEMNSLI